MRPNAHELVTLKRDCEAIEIPSGHKVSLFGGTEVIITQCLGGSYTVTTHQGLMASIGGKDADALGKEIPPESRVPDQISSEGEVEKLVWNQLRTCYDPEIPHNIVDLGLIYECRITPLDEKENSKKVDIRMTLTAPGCGMGEWLKQDVRNKILSVPTVKEVNVDVVFDPPWDRSKMSPALKRELY